ncbi:F-box/LRR-repeat protein 13 [Hippocampus comes]|uniref:F-box/LRR-repeat protein 13 n=1 Tax=Hippocampus comes TaxID=109280 RepID=UPI00094E7E0E|nr:PREDICTED: F-box/LRR-repeat protein 13 [Hippocampus comes]
MTDSQSKIEVSALTEYELQQLYKALLIASCRLDPRDPIQFLKNTLITFQGHDNLQDVDWDKFLSDSTQRSLLASLQLDDGEYLDADELKALFWKYEKAYSCYRRKLTSSCFRSWKDFTNASVTDASELSQKMEIALQHYDRRKQEVPFLAWLRWVKCKQESRVEAVRKLVGVLKACVLKRIVTAWKNVVRDSQRTKDYFKRLQNELEMERQQSQVGEGCDWLSALPNHISLKVINPKLPSFLIDQVHMQATNLRQESATAHSQVQLAEVEEPEQGSCRRAQEQGVYPPQPVTVTKAVRKLVGVLKACVLKRIVTAWKNVVRDSQRTKDYFKRLQNELEMERQQSQVGEGCDWLSALPNHISLKRLQNELEMERQQSQVGEGCDWLSALPNHISLKIFQYMELRDLLSCSEVCCSWRSLIHTGTLWSKINVSVDKRWITDDTMKDVLLNFRPFVIHLNLRGCTSLHWYSLKHIGECRNLQELNVSECFNITDAMIESIVEGCNSLLYLNLSSTLLTDATLRELASNCVNLQYLSLAYCHKMTDEGFQYLSLGTGCHNLLHLDLSGCSQVSLSGSAIYCTYYAHFQMYVFILWGPESVTATGFSYISEACPYLKEILLNDVYDLSDKCISALMANCQSVSSISLLEAWQLSDAGIKAIAEVTKLKSFSLEGNNRVSHMSWKALCSSSRGLRRLHIVECHKMGDTSLKAVATLRNLQYLDISLCNKVTDKGLFTLAESPSASKLRELNVSYCSQITDAAISVIGHRFTKLSHLNLSYCEQLTDVALEYLMGSSISSLDISGCNIQDDGLAALEEVPLKRLIIAECINITDVGMENLCKYLTDLEYVDVSGCLELSDQAVKAFSFYCRGLLTLRVAGCLKVTDMAMQCLSHGAAQYLRELDVSGCTLTDRAIRYIERLCPPLSSITMHGCNRISEEAAMRLQPYVQHWEYSNEQTKLWLR